MSFLDGSVVAILDSIDLAAAAFLVWLNIVWGD
jgi:hypothetical protein